MLIALDATYSIGDALSGVGLYSHEILHGLAASTRRCGSISATGRIATFARAGWTCRKMCGGGCCWSR